MGKLKCLHQVVCADDFHPRRLAQRPIIVKRFIDHVPTFNASFVAANDGHDMFAQTL